MTKLLKTLKDMAWYQDDINKPILKVRVDELKEEAIKLIKKAEEYKKILEERDRIENKYHKENPKDYYTDKYYKTCVNPFQKQEEELDKEFKKLGIEFACSDNGEDYCLSPEGLIIVIKILYNIIEEDLK